MNCVAVSEHIAQDQGIKLNVSLEPDLPAFPIDEARLKQALINLLANGIQTSVPGGCVSVSARNGRVGLLIDVTDCGPGIPVEKRDEIFSPFFTTKKEGVGLSLPIVKKIVEAHRAELRILDNPEGGLTFRMEIPKYPD